MHAIISRSVAVAIFASALIAGPAMAQATSDQDWSARTAAAHRILDDNIEATLRRGMASFTTMVDQSYPDATPAERAAMGEAMSRRLPTVIEQIQDMAVQMAVQRFTLAELEDPALVADTLWAALPNSLGDEVSRLVRRLGARVIVDACEAQPAMSAACHKAVRDAQPSLAL